MKWSFLPSYTWAALLYGRNLNKGEMLSWPIFCGRCCLDLFSATFPVGGSSKDRGTVRVITQHLPQFHNLLFIPTKTKIKKYQNYIFPKHYFFRRCISMCDDIYLSISPFCKTQFPAIPITSLPPPVGLRVNTWPGGGLCSPGSLSAAPSVQCSHSSAWPAPPPSLSGYLVCTPSAVYAGRPRSQQVSLPV